MMSSVGRRLKRLRSNANPAEDSRWQRSGPGEDGQGTADQAKLDPARSAKMKPTHWCGFLLFISSFAQSAQSDFSALLK
jgi:hypothetical protein